jgi:LUD domain
MMIQQQQNDSTVSKTRYGIPIDQSFSEPAPEERILLAAHALERNGFGVKIVDTLSEARTFVNSILPKDGSSIFTAGSETVRISGLDQDINVSGKYNSVRQQVMKLDPKTQFRDQVKLGATPDVVVGSVHAITENGEILVGSASGSQLGPYSASAGKVIWIVGSQKIVPDLASAFRRLETYSYPMEDARMRESHGMPSTLAKILIVKRELMPNRTNIVLVRETVGF